MYLLTCSQCGAMYDVPAEQARVLAAQAQDIDVPMSGGGFGGGLLGQLFGAQPAAEPYPTVAEDEFRTTPQATPDEPTRVRSQRLDGGA